jgi:hypothetical protein
VGASGEGLFANDAGASVPSATSGGDGDGAPESFRTVARGGPGEPHAVKSLVAGDGPRVSAGVELGLPGAVTARCVATDMDVALERPGPAMVPRGVSYLDGVWEREPMGVPTRDQGLAEPEDVSKSGGDGGSGAGGLLKKTGDEILLCEGVVDGDGSGVSCCMPGK